jgi:hypothetical protein
MPAEMKRFLQLDFNLGKRAAHPKEFDLGPAA